MTFVDTSALVAFLDRDAARHQEVVRSLAQLLRRRRAVTHNYVVIETAALAHRRLGANVVRRLLEDLVPALDVAWVDASLQRAAASAYLRALRRRSSLVDHVSFALMRERGIALALALDRHFAAEGFGVLPR